MIAITTFKGRRVALFGLGGSGVATARALMAGGANLVAFDDNPEKVAEAEAHSIPTGDFRQTGLHHHAALVLAPGVPLNFPQPHWSVRLAEAAGVPVIGDLELFAAERKPHKADCPFIAITGTNGKSTTTALISHILREAGEDVQMGGNIGTAMLSLEPFERGRSYVVECSSYQIDLAPSVDPDIGILLNLAPDHLDRHGTMDNYAAIKERLVAGSSTAIIGTDDDFSSAIASFLSAKGKSVWRISTTGRVERGVYADGSHLVFAQGGSMRTVADLASAPALRGQHNAQNAAAAWLACHLHGMADDAIRAGLESFPGLEHRMEPVARLGRVLFVNDSKATNCDAAARALASFEHIYWIAGGLAKTGGILPLRGYFDRIAKAYLVGEAAPEFAATLGKSTEYEISGTIEAAVRRAAADASRDPAAEPVVLLSPACASFDQYQNFEKRGDAFRRAVREIVSAESIEKA